MWQSDGHNNHNHRNAMKVQKASNHDEPKGRREKQHDTFTKKTCCGYLIRIPIDQKKQQNVAAETKLTHYMYLNIEIFDQTASTEEKF